MGVGRGEDGRGWLGLKLLLEKVAQCYVRCLAVRTDAGPPGRPHHHRHRCRLCEFCPGEKF